jgi:hypothetical protein
MAADEVATLPPEDMTVFSELKLCTFTEKAGRLSSCSEVCNVLGPLELRMRPSFK